MNFNYTLVGQLLAFILFVWFCMKYVWPPMMKVLEEREKEISDGLDAASRGKRELEKAQVKKVEVLKEAKNEAAELVNQANQRASQLVEDAKTAAQEEAERIKTTAQADLEQNTKRAKEELRSEVAALVVAGTEKILKVEIDQKKNSDLLDEMAKDL